VRLGLFADADASARKPSGWTPQPRGFDSSVSQWRFCPHLIAR
jgi:hypothetical protein